MITKITIINEAFNRHPDGLWDLGVNETAIMPNYKRDPFIEGAEYLLPEIQKRDEMIKDLRLALQDIANWDDDLEDEWDDAGNRAVEALQKLKKQNDQ